MRLQLRTYSFDGAEVWSTSAYAPIMMAVLRFRSSRHSIYYFECRHGVCPTPSHPETSQLLLTSVEGFSQPPQILDASMFGCTTFGSPFTVWEWHPCVPSSVPRFSAHRGPWISAGCGVPGQGSSPKNQRMAERD